MKLLITGGNGFVGRNLSLEALEWGFSVRVATRARSAFSEALECVTTGDIDGSTDWLNALKSCDSVVHLAARTDFTHTSASASLIEMQNVNVDGALALARQAAAAGIRRFIYISSIKVNGEATCLGKPFTAEDTPDPEDAYGLSKAEAEAGLRQIAEETGMEVTIIRPPLVYGPGVKGNFASLIKWLKRPVVLPFGAATKNRRSLVALDNLIDLILTCVNHPKAANETFLVSDGEDLSTAELLQRIGKIMKRRIVLLSIPVELLVFIARLLGKKAVAQRLFGSLQVDIGKTCELLNWKPRLSVDQGLRRAVEQRG